MVVVFGRAELPAVFGKAGVGGGSGAVADDGAVVRAPPVELPPVVPPPERPEPVPPALPELPLVPPPPEL
jgi:hypothetical protein